MKHLIIGGAGFIGSNLANSLLSQNQNVVILDSLVRQGSQFNLDWLRTRYPTLEFIKADITVDQLLLDQAISRADRIYHLAAQVAVTTSVTNPRHDFQINALGTFNVLESLRLHSKKDAILIYASTNKVYGEIDSSQVPSTGISENFPLNFHSPYGCSKGCGDQYVRDYSRIYDLNTIVFRQSCIYGPHQFGVEDQGWVAWFIIALLTGKEITIYGDGKQVRDVLYIDDLINAYQMAADNISKTKGQVFNIGGGPEFSISIWEDFKKILEKLHGSSIEVKYGDWRPGDQKIYISNIDLAQKIFNWIPQTPPKEGIQKLYHWVKNNLSYFNEK